MAPIRLHFSGRGGGEGEGVALHYTGDCVFGITWAVPKCTSSKKKKKTSCQPPPHLRLMASELSWGIEYSRGMVLYGLTEMSTSPVYV